MAKGGSQSTNTIQNSDPWSGQQGYLKDVYLQAARLGGSDVGTQYFPGDTFTPFSADTTAGMDAIRNAATQPAPGQVEAEAAAQKALTGGQANRTDVLNQAASGGMSNPVMKWLAAAALGGSLGGMAPAGAEGAPGPNSTPYVGEMLDAAGKPNTAGLDELRAGAGGNPLLQQLLAASGQKVTAGNDILNATAQGDYLNSNPWIDAAVDRASARVRDNTNAAFSSSGRYGSGSHGQTLSREIGDLASSMYGTAYETERGRQMQAIGELGSREQGDIERLLSGISAGAGLEESRLGRSMSVGAALGDREAADINRMTNAYSSAAGFGANDLNRQAGLLQTLAGLSESGLDRQVGAAESLNAYGLNQSQQSLQAMGLLPMLRDLDTAGARDLLGLGQMVEGQQGEELQAMIDRWNFEQQAPWDQLGRYNSIINGGANPGGSSSSTATGPGANPLIGALGGTAAGAGVASSLGLLGGAAGYSNPWGWAALAAGGLLGAYG